MPRPVYDGGFGAEGQLLLMCARAALHRGRVSEAGRLAEDGVGWPHLLDMANRHGMAPLLHRHLDECAHQDAVPPHVRQSLMDGYRVSASRTLGMTRELCRIQRRFQDERVPLVPFKGPTFGEYAYGDSCLRPFCDLDFLISKRDIGRAKALLLADGYQPEFDLERKQEAAFLREECEYSFYHPGKDVCVELHWNIVLSYASFGLSVEEILAHLVPFEFFGRQIMIPSPEYMLLILIVHNGGKHQWERLGWILDVAQLLRSGGQLDWERLTRLAARKGMSRALGLGLYLAQDLLLAELPESVSTRVRQDRTIKSLAADVYGRLFAYPESPPAKLDHLMFSLRVRNRNIDKARYCFAQLLTSDHEDRKRFILPRPLLPFYGLMRFARWLRS